MNKKIGLLLVVLVMVLSLVVAGCAPAAGPGTAPTPAPEAEIVKWAMQNTGSPTTPGYLMMDKLFADIFVATEGRLEITQYPGGAIVPAYEEIEGVETGALDMGSLTPSHENNRIPTADIFTCRVSGMDWRAIRAWYMVGGGYELLEEAFEEFPVKWLYGTSPTGEAWCHSTVELKSVEDLKGLTMRCRGDAGGMLTNLGVSTVFMPAGEIYEALQRGVIDAAEMDALSSNWPYAYHEVAEYLYLSKARAQASPGFFVVYDGSWNKLTDGDKMVVEYMCKAFNDYTSHMFTTLDIEAYQMFKDYGVKIAPIPCDINSALRAEATKYYASMAAADPFYAEVLNSQNEFYRVFNEAEELHRPIYCDEKL